jgi:YVTN family beta-propeller protein
MSPRGRVVALASLATFIAFSPALASSSRNGSAPPRLPWAAPAVQVGSGPLGVGVVQSTKTIYVVNQEDNTVSVISGATCNATHTRGCRQTPPTVAVGNGPLGVAVDQASNTIYVTNRFDNTVSVINGAACNAAVTSGCGQTPPTVAVGGFPSLLAVDQVTHTIYVANGDDGTVSVIDGNTCNGTDASGCGQTPPTVAVGSGPEGVAVNQATETIYVGNGRDDTVSVINGAICNATITSGCGQSAPTVAVGRFPGSLVVDEATNTVYVVDADDNAVSAIDGATCNGTVTTGCRQTPPTAPVGSNPIWITLNPATHTVYVINQLDSTVSALDATRCNATDSSGCAGPSPAMAIGFDGGAVAVDVATNTVYASSQGANTVSVLNGAKCNATRTSGCTRFAPTTTVGVDPRGIAADPATNTIYVGSRTDGTVSVIDGAACNASHDAGCGQSWPTISVGDSPQTLALDRDTNTLYTANGFDGQNTLSVIDGGACNGTHPSGCGQVAATVIAGAGAFAVAVNQVTDTVYVANRDDGTVSVIDGASCNGSDRSGCGQAWPTVTVGSAPQALGIDELTDTVYVTNTGGDTVSVIDGATCNGTNTSGCARTPATVTVGNAPRAVGVNPITRTIYVANRDDGTVSVIDGRRCNGADSSGCGQTPPTVTIGGFTGRGIAVDVRRNSVYATSIHDSDVLVIDGAGCRAGHTNGCHAKPLKLRAGGWPINLALNEATGTLYVSDNVDSAVSYYRVRG